MWLLWSDNVLYFYVIFHREGSRQKREIIAALQAPRCTLRARGGVSAKGTELALLPGRGLSAAQRRVSVVLRAWPEFPNFVRWGREGASCIPSCPSEAAPTLHHLGGRGVSSPLSRLAAWLGWGLERLGAGVGGQGGLLLLKAFVIAMLVAACFALRLGIGHRRFAQPQERERWGQAWLEQAVSCRGGLNICEHRLLGLARSARSHGAPPKSDKRLEATGAPWQSVAVGSRRARVPSPCQRAGCSLLQLPGEGGRAADLSPASSSSSSSRPHPCRIQGCALAWPLPACFDAPVAPLHPE